MKPTAEKRGVLNIGFRLLSTGYKRIMDSIRNVGIIAHVDAGNDQIIIDIPTILTTFEKCVPFPQCEL